MMDCTSLMHWLSLQVVYQCKLTLFFFPELLNLRHLVYWVFSLFIIFLDELSGFAEGNVICDMGCATNVRANCFHDYDMIMFIVAMAHKR